MLKKIFLFIFFLNIISLCYANNSFNTTLESTPFKIPKQNVDITADVINFAYNCVRMEDNSTIYEVISNSYAKSGSMIVTIHCFTSYYNVTLPLELKNNVITTSIKSYPVEFSKSSPPYCRDYTALVVDKNDTFPQGYTLRLQ